MKIEVKEKFNFDYRYCLEQCLVQLDFLYKNNAITMLDYVKQKDRICYFLDGDLNGTVTIKDLQKINHRTIPLTINDTIFLFEQIQKGTWISTKFHSGFLTKKLIINKEYFFQLNETVFVEMKEITKIGF
tara:strand:+ start:1730 stop:2119 length:390 start_codon:yes stop_codon:yes gene_type:complete